MNEKISDRLAIALEAVRHVTGKERMTQSEMEAMTAEIDEIVTQALARQASKH